MTPPGARTGPRSVLLAEHEPDVAEMSARYLRRDGMAVRLVTEPEQALAELTAGPDGGSGPDLTVLDLTVLDLTMPGLDPRRIRRALRTPVIFLVAGPQGPRPRGLARGPAGPRRWLARPFGPRQLVAVAREVLAEAPRTTQDEDQPAERVAGALRLTGPRSCVANGHPVKLTATEFAVLAALLAPPGRVLSRRQLLAAAGRPAAGDRAADVYVAQLRAKLKAAGAAGAVRTVRAAGYVADP